MSVLLLVLSSSSSPEPEAEAEAELVDPLRRFHIHRFLFLPLLFFYVPNFLPWKLDINQNIAHLPMNSSQIITRSFTGQKKLPSSSDTP